MYSSATCTQPDSWRAVRFHASDKHGISSRELWKPNFPITHLENITAKGCQSNGMSRQMNVRAMGCHSKGMSIQRDVTAKRRQSTGMSKQDATAKGAKAMGCQSKGMSKQWDNKAMGRWGRPSTRGSLLHLPLLLLDGGLAREPRFHIFSFQVLRGRLPRELRFHIFHRHLFEGGATREFVFTSSAVTCLKEASHERVLHEMCSSKWATHDMLCFSAQHVPRKIHADPTVPGVLGSFSGCPRGVAAASGVVLHNFNQVCKDVSNKSSVFTFPRCQFLEGCLHEGFVFKSSASTCLREVSHESFVFISWILKLRLQICHFHFLKEVLCESFALKRRGFCYGFFCWILLFLLFSVSVENSFSKVLQNRLCFRFGADIRFWSSRLVCTSVPASRYLGAAAALLILLSFVAWLRKL